jgi:hypothetical protein
VSSHEEHSGSKHNSGRQVLASEQMLHPSGQSEHESPKKNSPSVQTGRSRLNGKFGSNLNPSMSVLGIG